MQRAVYAKWTVATALVCASLIAVARADSPAARAETPTVRPVARVDYHHEMLAECGETDGAGPDAFVFGLRFEVVL